MDNTMPFTGETSIRLHSVLKYIANSDLPIEMFDAFLAEYKRTGNLMESLFFAQCEWDC